MYATRTHLSILFNMKWFVLMQANKLHENICENFLTESMETETLGKEN